MSSTDMAGFTGWDVFLLAATGMSVALGLLSGLVRTVFGLASWFVALLLAPWLAPWLSVASGVDLQTPWLWLLCFLVVFVAVRLLGWLLAKGLKQSGLGGVDRLAGGVFGLARAALLVVAVVAVAGMLGVEDSPSWRNAASRGLLDAVLGWLRTIIPIPESGIITT